MRAKLGVKVGDEVAVVYSRRPPEIVKVTEIAARGGGITAGNSRYFADGCSRGDGWNRPHLELVTEAHRRACEADVLRSRCVNLCDKIEGKARALCDGHSVSADEVVRTRAAVSALEAALKALDGLKGGVA